MKPDFQALGGVYVLNWTNEQIRMRIDRLRDARDGDVTAEVTIIGTANGLSPHLHQARLNITSTRSRSELSKVLGKRHPLEWDALIEQACVMTLGAYREGEPVVDVGDHGDGAAMPVIE